MKLPQNTLSIPPKCKCPPDGGCTERCDRGFLFTDDEIEKLVRRVHGGWVKRNNLRKNLLAWNEIQISTAISKKRDEIRRMYTASEAEKREHYAEISRLEMLRPNE